MPPHTVVVADDHPLFRDGLARALRSSADLAVVGEAEDGAGALALIREHRPDVAVVDLRIPRPDGLAVARAVTEEAIGTRVVIVSGYDDPALVYGALEAGAISFLTKDAPTREIVDAVARAARGTATIPAHLADALAGAIRARAARPAIVLTPREREVLGMLAEGLSAPEIGRRLYLGASTVKSHLTSLYAKLGVNDRAAAVAEAMRAGLLD